MWRRSFVAQSRHTHLRDRGRKVVEWSSIARFGRVISADREAESGSKHRGTSLGLPPAWSPGMSGGLLCSLESAGTTVTAEPATVLVRVLVLVLVLVPVALSVQADSFLTSVASSYRRVAAATVSPWTSPESARRSLRTSRPRERASEGPMRAASCRGKAGSPTLNGLCRQTLDVRYTESTRCKHGKPTWTCTASGVRQCPAPHSPGKGMWFVG